MIVSPQQMELLQQFFQGFVISFAFLGFFVAGMLVGASVIRKEY